ncbi:MAG: hypothetical protein HY736_09485 [Verrucomicrobia bacterium]|nr:hypothetical protein [Verrucomicrobiota bacterium]
MKCFGLTREDSPGAGQVTNARSPGLSFSMLYGSVSFGAVSVLAYSIWAYRLVPGTAAMYATIAAVYVGLSGLALSRLVLAPGAWKRFPLFFATVFIVYALCWCAFWFGLKGKFHADLFGAVAGLAVATWMLQGAFGQPRGYLRLFAVLLALHSAGYYLGGELYALVRGSTGRLLWGAAHGLGFGAGLGYVLFQCQIPPTRSANSKVR